MPSNRTGSTRYSLNVRSFNEGITSELDGTGNCRRAGHRIRETCWYTEKHCGSLAVPPMPYGKPKTNWHQLGGRVRETMGRHIGWPLPKGIFVRADRRVRPPDYRRFVPVHPLAHVVVVCEGDQNGESSSDPDTLRESCKMSSVYSDLTPFDLFLLNCIFPHSKFSNGSVDEQ